MGDIETHSPTLLLTNNCRYYFSLNVPIMPKERSSLSEAFLRISSSCQARPGYHPSKAFQLWFKIATYFMILHNPTRFRAKLFKEFETSSLRRNLEELRKIGRSWQFNSLWLNDAIRRQRSGSTLGQIMTCCLTSPSHYLTQCWLMISKV